MVTEDRAVMVVQKVMVAIRVQIVTQVQSNYGKALTAWQQATCLAILPLKAAIARLMQAICRRFYASF